jgi:two-component system phosphate regulon response regulator PhoB
MKGRVVLAGGDAGRRFELLKILREGGYAPSGCDTLLAFRTQLESDPPIAMLLLYPDQGDVVDAIFAQNADLITRSVTLILSESATANERARSRKYKADEFLIEPISPGELVAALDLNLKEASPIKRRGVLKVGDLELDRDKLVVALREQPLMLHPVHVRVLEFLMCRVGKAFSRREIVTGVWGPGDLVDERTVDVVIGRIRDAVRHKVAVDPILTIRGAGYAFNEQFEGARSLPKKQRLRPKRETRP